MLEGVAFSLRDTFEIFREMGVPVEAEEGAAYGAALLAGAGCGAWATVDEACDAVVRVSRTIEPDPQAVDLLNERYEAFRRLYPALKFVAEGGRERMSAERGTRN